MNDDTDLFTYECERCGADVRVVGEQRGEWGTSSRQTAEVHFACGCSTSTAASDPSRMPPHWVQNMDYVHPESPSVEAGECR